MLNLMQIQTVFYPTRLFGFFFTLSFNHGRVASVGGDGTFSDCCNGMLLRAAREAQTNVNDTAVKMPRTSRRVTIIPTGSDLSFLKEYEAL